MKKTTEIGIVIVLLAAMCFLFMLSLSRSEKVECYKWQDQAKQYPGFYLTQWQAMQCEAHGFTIDVPVK